MAVLAVVSVAVATVTLAHGLLVPAVLAGVLALGLSVLMLFRWPHRGLWLMAAALPFERLGTYDAGLLTVKAGHVISLGMLASWASRTVLSGARRLAKDPLRPALLLLLAASVLSMVNSLNIVRSGALIVQLLIVFVVYSLTLNFATRDTFKGIFIAIWVSSFAVALFGLYQFIGDLLGLPTSVTGLRDSYSGKANFGFARIQGPALEPLYFANYLMLPIFTSAAFFFGSRFKRRPLLAGLLVVLLIVFVLTLARGAYLALGVAGIYFAYQYRREVFTPKVVTGVIISLTVVAIAVTVLLLQNVRRGGDPLAAFAKQIGVSGKDTSSQQRLGSIGAATELVGQHPFLGVGIGNFGEYYQDPLTGLNTSEERQVVNNQTLETLVETGLFGLLGLVLLVLVMIERTRLALRKVGNDRFMKAALVGVSATGIAILVQSQSFSALYLLHVWFVIGLLVAIQNTILNRETT